MSIDKISNILVTITLIEMMVTIGLGVSAWGRWVATESLNQR